MLSKPAAIILGNIAIDLPAMDYGIFSAGAEPVIP